MGDNETLEASYSYLLDSIKGAMTALESYRKKIEKRESESKCPHCNGTGLIDASNNKPEEEHHKINLKAMEIYILLTKCINALEQPAKWLPDEIAKKFKSRCSLLANALYNARSLVGGCGCIWDHEIRQAINYMPDNAYKCIGDSIFALRCCRRHLKLNEFDEVADELFVLLKGIRKEF